MRGNIIQLDLTSEQLNEAIAQWKARNSIPRTNADRIRAMSDEELARKISGLESFALTCGSAMSPEKWLEWLRKEARE